MPHCGGAYSCNCVVTGDGVSGSGTLSDPYVITSVPEGGGVPTWSTISGKPAVVAEGATQADARTAIGAGTSSFSGAYADLTGEPTTMTPTAHEHTAADVDSGASSDGQVLTSDGAGGAAWEPLPPGVQGVGVSTVWAGSQAAYDAISTPDPSTIYFVTG